jgi:hypothetical protein
VSCRCPALPTVAVGGRNYPTQGHFSFVTAVSGGNLRPGSESRRRPLTARQWPGASGVVARKQAEAARDDERDGSG